MSLTRRLVVGALAATPLVTSLPASAQDKPTEAEADAALAALLSRDPGRLFAALKTLEDFGEPSLAPGLILMMRFGGAAPSELKRLLSQVTGDGEPLNWYDWMIWQERHPGIRPTAGYNALKTHVFQLIDPNFEVFLRPEYLTSDRARIRFEEVTWGGVRKDGIPSLDNPELLSAYDADYMRDDDLVFGVSINGDTRAYPLRIMGWHEMFNEVIGGVPVALAYCTLCGAGILFETDVEGREAPFIFGSSGFLYRSNKLMFDRETHTLWNQFTGKPVIGPLVDSDIALKQRPVTITSWKEWRAANPHTKVLSLNTGHFRDYGSGVVYHDYFASPDLMFPTLVDQTRLKQKDYVFGIRTFGGSKAWPISAFAGGRVINDSLGPLNLVLIGDQASRTVRAYDRGALNFAPGDKPGKLIADGADWSVGEEALKGPDGRSAPRVAGHIAYWFAWDGYLGERSEFYEG